MADYAEQFDCIECGRHIIRLVPDGTGHLCAACIFVPGWFRDADLRWIFDRDHSGLAVWERSAAAAGRGPAGLIRRRP